MKKQFVSLFMMLVMLVSFVPAFENCAAAESAQMICDAASAEPGRIGVANIGTDIAYRLLLPDGTRTSWHVRSADEEDSVIFEPLDGGDYYLETCPLGALTVLDAQADYLPEKYDLFSDVPASEVHTGEKITVAQPEDEGDNIVDLAQGDVLLSPSYNAYAVFASKYDLFDSDLELSALTDAPSIQYVSTDDGMTWKKLTGDITLISSAAQPVASGVSYALYCGDYPMTLTLDNAKTTGTIYTAPIGDTIVKIKGDVSVKRIDTDYLGKLTILGADSSAKLTVSRSISSSCIEIKDLAELNIEGTTVAINNIMGDLKLTNIPNLDIKITSEQFASGILSYDGSIIFTDVFGSIHLVNDPSGIFAETGIGKKLIINTDGSYVYAGEDIAHLESIALQTEDKITGVFPEDRLSACLFITNSATAPVPPPSADDALDSSESTP